MMFTRTAANKIVPRVAARYSSTATTAAKPNVWLSDPSTYPIIAVMAVAVTGCSGFMAYKFTTDKAICVTQAHKKSTLRN